MRGRYRTILISIISCIICIFIGGLFFLHFLFDSLENESDISDPSTRQTMDSSTEKANSIKYKPSKTEHIVYIETGHGLDDNGKWDRGCSWSDGVNEYVEADVMLPIAKAMVSYLRNSGIVVYTDADEDNNKNLEETMDFLDDHREVDVFVNLHCDWAEAESGTMPLYLTDEQLALANSLNDGVHSCVDIPDRGPTYRDDLQTLTNEKIHCPAVLFETGSIKADNKILTQKYDDYGKGLAIGLCEYLGVDLN